jgi:penicillin-binding protein 2
MIAVAHDEEGTAFRYFENYPIKVAAKTGTAETGFEDVSSSNGLFIAYAPADNPEVAVAQIIEKGAWGSNTIGITKDLFNAYFRLNDTGKADPSLIPGWPDQLAAPTPTVTPTPPVEP